MIDTSRIATGRPRVALINRRSLPYGRLRHCGKTALETERNGRIIIAGTGPVGLTAALALADIGMPVTLAGPPPSADDRRTTALMTPALAFLDGLGILAALDGDDARTSVDH